MIDPNERDRFVVTRRRRLTVTPSLSSVDIYDVSLPVGEDHAGERICHVRQRVSRFDERIGFFADEARTVALMHLNARAL